LANITNWENEKIIKLRDSIRSDMLMYLEDIKFIAKCGNLCIGPLCVYPDLDIDDTPTFVKIIREIGPSGEYCVEIIALDEISVDSSMAQDIKQSFNEIENESYWKSQKERYNRSINMLHSI